jgi:hypothetical protein
MHSNSPAVDKFPVLREPKDVPTSTQNPTVEHYLEPVCIAEIKFLKYYNINSLSTGFLTNMAE